MSEPLIPPAAESTPTNSTKLSGSVGQGETPEFSEATSPPAPRLRQTAGLIFVGWVGLALLTLLLQELLERSDGLYLIVLLVGTAFTGVAIFDHVWRRIDRHPGRP